MLKGSLQVLLQGQLLVHQDPLQFWSLLEEVLFALRWQEALPSSRHNDESRHSFSSRIAANLPEKFDGYSC